MMLFVHLPGHMTVPHGSQSPSLGPCCNCGIASPCVRTIVMLDFRAPVPGTGWGCVVCSLPSDGAIAVLCDRCAAEVEQRKAPLQSICAGFACESVRVPYPDNVTPFQHRLEAHILDALDLMPVQGRPS